MKCPAGSCNLSPCDSFLWGCLMCIKSQTELKREIERSVDDTTWLYICGRWAGHRKLQWVCTSIPHLFRWPSCAWSYFPHSSRRFYWIMNNIIITTLKKCILKKKCICPMRFLIRRYISDILCNPPLLIRTYTNIHYTSRLITRFREHWRFSRGVRDRRACGVPPPPGATTSGRRVSLCKEYYQ